MTVMIDTKAQIGKALCREWGDKSASRVRVQRDDFLSVDRSKSIIENFVSNTHTLHSSMVETKIRGSSHSPGSTGKPGGGRFRVISSCLTCRRRKVKCDHVHPVCGSCNRGNHVCTWTDQAQPTTATGRISKSTASDHGKSGKSGDVQSRLDRLEYLLEKAVAGQGPNVTSSMRSSSDYERKEDALTPSSTSQTSHNAGIASDDGDGTLLLNGGQSQFVSSLHFALLADEIQDIKALLGEKTDEEKREVSQNSLVDLLSLGRAGSGANLQNLLPNTQEQRDFLLGVYFSNVDPMVRVTHRPTMIRRFPSYNRDAHPMAYATYFSAINALSPKAVEDKFGESKEALLDRFQLGIEISLARENYLTTSDLEILQAFVIWLSCVTREEEMGRSAEPSFPSDANSYNR
ncbi:C6 transcription factor [Pyrenophora seminiperda CCB06]|uniref:C6 transcription factor n=1 Tax=Pyrenophora seminiperda CCB06 TaxID=1302712 RepID=A0A3M7M8U1_9PLEO|nr:C6 transcription factor [Pyrenophora seminiperda CCB06]